MVLYPASCTSHGGELEVAAVQNVSLSMVRGEFVPDHGVKARVRPRWPLICASTPFWLRAGARLAVPLATALLCAGCSLFPPTPKISTSTVIPRAATSPKSSPALKTDISILTGVIDGSLTAATATSSGTNGGRTVDVSGVLQGVSVKLTFANLAHGQRLSIPPLVEAFEDWVSLQTAGPKSADDLQHRAGYQQGTYQGSAGLDLDRSRRGGRIEPGSGAPENQPPSVPASGNSVTWGCNSGSAWGTWAWP